MKKSIIIFSACAFLLTACDKTFKPEPHKTEEDLERERIGSIFGEGGLKLFSSEDRNNGGGIGVNAYLWRASLEVFKFLPFNQTDPFGGVLISDWYTNPETPNQRIKVNIFILDTVLRGDAIRVALFKQTRKDSTSSWQDAFVNEATNRKLENQILIKARENRIGSINTKED